MQMISFLPRIDSGKVIDEFISDRLYKVGAAISYTAQEAAFCHKVSVEEYQKVAEELFC